MLKKSNLLVPFLIVFFILFIPVFIYYLDFFNELKHKKKVELLEKSYKLDKEFEYIKNLSLRYGKHKEFFNFTTIK